MTREVAAKIVATIVATYPTPSWEKQTMQVYRDMIEDLDEGVTVAVVNDWIKTHDDRPSIAAIRREVAKAQQPKGLFMPPDEAWAYVSQCFGTVGQYREFPDLHPLVKRAVDGIGWQEMCRSDNIDVIRGQFRMAYQALLERSVVETATSEGAAMLPTAAVPALERRPALLS